MTIDFSWNEIETACRIIADNLKGNDFTDTVLVGFENGGVIPAMIIYKMINNPTLQFQTIHPDNDNPMYNRKVLGKHQRYIIIDDINDSGKTINKFMGMMSRDSHFENSSFVVMTLIGRQSSKALSFSAIVVNHKEWFKFPWEFDEPEVRNQDI